MVILGFRPSALPANLLTLLIFIVSVLSSCGLLDFGEGGTINDPEPSGTITHSGSFGSNEYGISGTVYAYLVSEGGTVIRLEGFSSETTSQLLVVGETTTGSQPLSAALKGTSGNQNYSISQTISSWVSVSIVSSALPSSSNELATALLDPVNP